VSIRVGELAALVLVLIFALPGNRAWADAGDQESLVLMQTQGEGEGEGEEEEEPDCE
jgi:hypothetical protein